MAEPVDRLLIAPSLPSSKNEPDALGPGRPRRRELPDDLLRQAAHRLGMLSLLAAALWLVSTVLYHYVDRVVAAGDASWMTWQPSDVPATVAIVLSLALFFYTRYSRRSPAFILNLGLIYMVVMAFVAGLTLHWAPHAAEMSTTPRISWLGVMVLVFAAILPVRPATIMMTGIVAVAMNPVGMLVARARGAWIFDNTLDAWTMHYQDVLLVGAAGAVAYVVSSLSQQVARARELGSYQLGELIGRGGMGEVYRATHRMLARPAAIKLIRPGAHGGTRGARRAAEARFRREAEAAAQLRSVHTVVLYDFGVASDGTLYFAMELLDGMDLESLVQASGPLPASRVIHLLRQVCESLEEAHERGLVHRDIKPANIHVGRLGPRSDFVKVLDFGLVTATHGSGTPTMTSTGNVLRGTPAYIAPEMAMGGQVDGRADLYALGCVAYFLLTGQLVFEADNPLQTIMRRLQDDPLPPSQRTELPVPPALDALVLACLARSPADRPHNARALRLALDAIDVAPWTDDDAAAWWGRRGPDGEDTGRSGQGRTATVRTDKT